MMRAHDLYIELRKTDLRIAQSRYQLNILYRHIACLHGQPTAVRQAKTRARKAEEQLRELCAHRDDIIRQVTAANSVDPPESGSEKG